MKVVLECHAAEGLLDESAVDPVFLAVRHALDHEPPGAVIDLSAAGVRLVTPRFVDRAIARVLVWFSSGLARRPLVMTDVVDGVAEVLEDRLSQLGLCLLVRDPDGVPRLLGDHATLLNSASVARELGEFTTLEFAARAGMNKSGAQRRLTELQRVGAVTRRVERRASPQPTGVYALTAPETAARP